MTATTHQPPHPPYPVPPVTISGPVDVNGMENVFRAVLKLRDDVDDTRRDVAAMRHDLSIITFWFKLLTVFAVLGLLLWLGSGVLQILRLR